MLRFNPFFLSRTGVSDLSKFIGDVRHEFVANVDQIKYIAPEKLKMIPCDNPSVIHTAEGIGFDLQAAIVLIQMEPKKKVLEYIIGQANSFSYKDPLRLYCKSSRVDGALPYIEIMPDMTIQVGIIPLDYNQPVQNAYDFRYVSAT